MEPRPTIRHALAPRAVRFQSPPRLGRDCRSPRRYAIASRRPATAPVANTGTDTAARNRGLSHPKFTTWLTAVWVIVVTGWANHAGAQPESFPLRWDFESQIQGDLHGNARVEWVGPTAQMGFVGLPERNRALVLDAPGGYIRVEDHETGGPLDFGLGDCITLESWVRLQSGHARGFVYIIGKGRTYESGRRENHNYALRLACQAGDAKPSFLFSTQTTDGQLQYHRWTASEGFAVDGQWHHVAVSYQFGYPDSIRGFVDGRQVGGRWDMAGPTDQAPINDNDSLWIGSSRGGAPESSLVGQLDDVTIHRRIIQPKEIAQRRVVRLRPPAWPQSADGNVVAVRLCESAISHSQFPSLALPETMSFATGRMVLHRLPVRYASGGIRDRWRGPVLAQMFTKATLPSGPIELLVRAPGKSRLWIDEQVVVETPPRRLFPSAHEPFEVYDPVHPSMRTPHVGDREKIVTWQSDGKPHRFILETLVGSKDSRCEPGETTVAWRHDQGPFRILTPDTDQPLDGLPNDLFLVDADMEALLAWSHGQLDRLDLEQLQLTSQQEDAFWKRRHALARKAMTSWPQQWLDTEPDASIDSILQHLIDSAGLDPEEQAALAQPIDDLTFLRRLSLDTIGVPPTLAEIDAYLNQAPESRRAWAIEQRLTDPRWADHWTSFWQDLLAENPNILKPTLNNTGPFRFWIHDALLMNKPLDRFVTELIRMEGDPHAGGPAGFGMATQNDVPLAEKAHILVAAFLGEDLKCARCHDAPYHPWRQSDLFQIAAMLNNNLIVVPETSSVPATFFQRRGEDAPIQVTLHPGDKIEPRWPSQLLPDLMVGAPLDPALLPRGDSPREQLAALVTRGENYRFPAVVANRVWQRLIGWAFVDEPNNWVDSSVRHQRLLALLTRRLVESGYDLKALTREIVSSDFYARQAIDDSAVSGGYAYLAPWRRRLTAEQVVDSLHTVTGVPMRTEALTFDPEGSQRRQNFLNLGPARRAWQLTSLANERDRPSLSLPQAAAVAECLEAFGWRASRQAPIEFRPTDINLLPPAILANGPLTTYVCRLTDQSAMTRLACDATRPDQLVERLFMAILTRPPTAQEKARFVELLAPGFDQRRNGSTVPPPDNQLPRGFVTWSNHFDVRANKLMRELERQVVEGPPPTQRLTSDWRERAEDAVWALVNAPEFQLVP